MYVDDIFITGNNPALIQRIIASLGSKFAIKDLGSLHYFLGIEVAKVPIGLILSQTKYAQDLLQRAEMSDCRPCASPSSLKPPVLPADSLFAYPDFYRAIVGSLQYLTLTRPDIAYSVNAVCQHMHKPMDSDFTSIKHILRYLQGSLHQGLLYTKGSLHLIAYIDADWAGDSIDKRSTGGYYVYLGPNLLVC